MVAALSVAVPQDLRLAILLHEKKAAGCNSTRCCGAVRIVEKAGACTTHRYTQATTSATHRRASDMGVAEEV